MMLLRARDNNIQSFAYIWLHKRNQNEFLKHPKIKWLDGGFEPPTSGLPAIPLKAKSKPLKARIFSVICKETGSIHCNLLLHTSLCWLSRGKELARVFELRNKLLIFFENKFVLSCRLHE